MQVEKMIDYKSKYEDALERAKKLRDKLKYSSSSDAAMTVTELEEIFPQLAESEDERIRKEIIDIVEAYRANCVYEGTHRFDDCLAYLEKQKEQKPASDIEDAAYNYANNFSQYDDSIYCEIVDAYKAGAYYMELKQQEQKPAEDSDFKTKLASYMEKNQENGRYALSSESILEMAEEELLKRGVVQKPVEWSEDFDTLFDKHCDQHPDGLTLEECGKFFYERGKETQKWSEEDEKMLNSCISSIEEAKENRYAYKETDGDTSYDHEINFLKSLRPQPKWKPTEEQMNSLNFGIHALEEEGYDETAREIKDLYADLKKLMEE